MIPEETNPTQTTPEEPLAPTPVPALETAARAEPQDDGSVTPPHGDPLGFTAFEAPPAAVDAPVIPAAEALPEEVSVTPPHGDPLAEAAFDAALPADDAPVLFAPAELSDATSFTPPHGDPLGHSVFDSPTPLGAEPVTAEPSGSDHVVATPLDSEPIHAFTAEIPVEPAPATPELLYSGPVELAPAGAFFTDPEPVAVTETVVEPVTVVEDTAAELAHEQPEQLYAGPVEPAPAGLYLADPLQAGDPAEATVATGDPLAYPNAEVHDDLEAAALVTEAVALEPEPPEEHEVPMEGGPNWMLAFICAWSSAISLREAWVTLAGGGLGMILRNLGVLGYLLLGVGLLAFAFDALRWGRPRRGVGALVIPTLLTLAGVVCLVLWNDRGRPI